MKRRYKILAGVLAILGVILLNGVFYVMLLIFLFARWDPHSDPDDGFATTTMHSVAEARARPVWSSDGARIAFVHDGRIYVVDSSGSRLRSVDGSGPPSMSPGGNRIVHASWLKDRTWEIVTSDLDGSERRSLGVPHRDPGHPAWSPDGSQIAFMSNGRLYAAAADGSGQRWSSDDHDHFHTSPPPVWSPDGLSIAFLDVRRARTASGDVINFIFVSVIGADGSNLRRLPETESPLRGIGDVSVPAWSPDGGRIAFLKSRDGLRGLYTIASDGSDVREVLSLPASGGMDGNVSWSPDGTEILVGPLVISLDGSSLLRLPGPVDRDGLIWPAGPGRASWSPDGSRIAVQSRDHVEGKPDVPAIVLYTVNRDGSDSRVLVVQGGDGNLSPGSGSLPDEDWAASATYHFGGAGPSPEPVDVAGCSNGIAVPSPESHPLLVRDCETLLRMRDSLGSSPPLNWSTNRSIGEWTGVGIYTHGTPPAVESVVNGERFDRINIHGPPSAVKSLRLQGPGQGYRHERILTGVIPPEIGLLSSLRVLHLQNNWLGGEVPSQLGNLTELESIDLSNNRLVGCIRADGFRATLDIRHDPSVSICGR